MGVGAYIQKVLRNSINASCLSHTSHFKCWHFFFGGAISSVLLGNAVQATPLPLINLLADADTSTVTTANPIEDGIYFYGAAAEPDTLGTAYMVFEAQDARLVGALFMPQSSFDCFQGQLDGHELALQITNSYTQEVYGYAIALVTDTAPIAAVDGSVVDLQLDGFHNLGTPRDSEIAILSICQDSFSDNEVEL